MQTVWWRKILRSHTGGTPPQPTEIPGDIDISTRGLGRRSRSTTWEQARAGKGSDGGNGEVSLLPGRTDQSACGIVWVDRSDGLPRSFWGGRGSSARVVRPRIGWLGWDPSHRPTWILVDTRPPCDPMSLPRPRVRGWMGSIERSRTILEDTWKDLGGKKRGEHQGIMPWQNRCSRLLLLFVLQPTPGTDERQSHGR